jgi:hypothetical protein
MAVGASVALATEKVKPIPKRANRSNNGVANLCLRYFDINFIII